MRSDADWIADCAAALTRLNYLRAKQGGTTLAGEEIASVIRLYAPPVAPSGADPVSPVPPELRRLTVEYAKDAPPGYVP